MMIGEKIYNLRKNNKLSQEELALQLTISRQAISKWELGEAIPDTENVVQLSKVFNVSTDYLLIDDYNYDETNPATTADNGKPKATWWGKISAVFSHRKTAPQHSFCRTTLSNMLEHFRRPRFLFSATSIAFVVSIFVCITCDFTINHTLTWSLYPIGSCVFAWLTFLPLMIKLKKRNIIVSICLLSLLTIPFLFWIEYASDIKNWVIPLGIPIVIASIAYILVASIVLLVFKFKNWYKAAILVLLIAPLNYFIDYRAAVFSDDSTDFLWLKILPIVLFAIVLFFIGFTKRTKAKSTA